MPETPIKTTKTKLARIYGAGILAFSAIVGFITLLVIFLANVKVA
jgi:hypothetical protein